MLTSNRLLLKGQQNQRATRPKIQQEKQINKKKRKQNKKPMKKKYSKIMKLKLDQLKSINLI